MDVGIRIRELREKLGLSNRELASLAGLSQPVMHRLENNERSADIETLEKVCEALNITLLQFFNEDIDPVVITPELKQLLDTAKDLTPQQLESLVTFIRSIRVVKKTLEDGTRIEYAQAPGGRELTEEEEKEVSDYIRSNR
jgi:transcriptional regulator with XRE-family HTH domain